MSERLQKIIARAGIASRRKAEELIIAGRVTVNGQVVTQLGASADLEHDHVKVDGKLIHAEPLEYWAVNKPRAMLSTVSDSRKRPIVTDLVRSRRRLYPAGRLDYHSEGLMILTNDGELTRRIMKSGEIEKTYLVKVQGQPPEDKLDLLRRGIRLDGIALESCRIRLVRPGESPWFEVVLRQGKNRQIRRMFEKIGYRIQRIRRIAIDGLELGDLRVGASRPLTEHEVNTLKGIKKGQKHVHRNR